MPSGLNSLKTKVDELNVDKLKPLSKDLIKLIDAVDKKADNKSDISGFINKSDFDRKIETLATKE